MDIYQQINAIENVIAGKTGVTIDQMRGRNRDAQTSHARHIVWVLAYDYLDFTYPQIAMVYDRDHTTIISGANRLRKEVNIETIVEDIRKEIPEILEKKELLYTAKTRR